jgi:hypothetical protein
MKVLKVLKMIKILFEHLAPFAGPAAVSPMGATHRCVVVDIPYKYLRSFRPYLAFTYIYAIQGSLITLQKNYFVIWFATCRT